MYIDGCGLSIKHIVIACKEDKDIANVICFIVGGISILVQLSYTEQFIYKAQSSVIALSNVTTGIKKVFFKTIWNDKLK